MEFPSNNPVITEDLSQLAEGAAASAIAKKEGTEAPPAASAEPPATPAAPSNPEPAAPPAQPTSEPKQPEDLSKAFAALARREKKLLDMQRAIDQARSSGKTLNLDEIKAKAAEDPESVLSMIGLDFNAIVDRRLASEPTLEDRVKQQEEKIRNYEKQAEEARIAREKAAEAERIDKAVQTFKNEIRQTAEQDKEKFELVLAFDAIDDVFDVCEEYFTRHGKQLDIAQAVQAVENKLVEMLETRALKTNKAKSFFERSRPGAVPTPPGSKSPTLESKQATTPTLTNKMTLQPSVGSDQPLLSREESLARAAALLKWR